MANAFIIFSFFGYERLIRMKKNNHLFIAMKIILIIFINSSPFAIRSLNDQLTLMERAFIDPEGLPGRPLARFALFITRSRPTMFLITLL